MKLLIVLALLPVLGSACGLGYDVWFDGRCFKQSYQTKTYYADALSVCEKDGAQLPAIKSYDDNSDMFVSLQHQFGRTFWLGLSCDGEKFVWADGSEAKYTQFADAYTCTPRSTGRRYFYGDDEQWHESDSGRGFGVSNVVCEEKARAAVNVTNSQPAECPQNRQFGPGDDIYSPAYPSAPGLGICEYLLVEADPNKRVQVEISFLELNSCCDTLTVYDGLDGANVLANLTGYHANPINIVGNSNAVRFHWNAMSGVHVRGFHAKMKNSVSKSG